MDCPVPYSISSSEPLTVPTNSGVKTAALVNLRRAHLANEARRTWSNPSIGLPTRPRLEPFGSTFRSPTRQRCGGVDDADFMRCPHCDLRVYIGAFWQPVSTTERDADDYGPRAFVITGRNRLIHRCLIAEHTSPP